MKKKTDGKVVATIDGVVKKIGTVGDAAAEGDNSDDGDDKDDMDITDSSMDYSGDSSDDDVFAIIEGEGGVSVTFSVGELNLDRAAELYVTIAYDSSEGEVTSSQYILMVLDKDNDWKVCFAGSKAQAYADGIITDENSEKAEANAQAVYEAAEKAVKELSKDKSYKFEYMNYISTETDKFIEKIKEQLPDELRDTYFTVFIDEGKLDYVVWSQEAGSEITVTYPEKKN